jgi:hypothetical protein
MDSQNEQKLKCALRCFQKIDIDGFTQPVTVYPVCIIDNMGENMDVIVDITHKVETVVEKEEEAVVEEEALPTREEEVAIVPEEIEEDSDVDDDDDTIPIVPEENEHDDDFVVEDPFISDDRWKEVELKETKKVEDLLFVFNQQIASLMERLDTMKQKQEDEDDRLLPPLPSPPQEEERPLPPTPPQGKKPHPPQPKEEERPLPHPPHHAPKIEIVEEEANIRASEFKPHPPPSKPHPPKQPLPQVETPLNTQIVKLQRSYDNISHIDKNIVRVILDHMKCIEQFDLSGVEKKSIVLSSIETILSNNSIKDTAGLILELSSQLIDTFIAFDKDKINITEKRLSALSCFPCKN